jgi:predicted RNA-binding Zn ribbon-like protein
MAESMGRASFQFIAGNLALDFLNTVGNRLEEPRYYFTAPAAARRWVSLAGAGPPAAVEDEAPLTWLRGLREELYALLAPLAAGAECSPARLARLNRRLVRLPARTLTARGGRAVWRWADGSDLEKLEATILLSAAELLTSPAAARLRQCQDARCGWLFLDHSQAGRRRWCSMAGCGNRAKARRHQRRRAE